MGVSLAHKQPSSPVLRQIVQDDPEARRLYALYTEAEETRNSVSPSVPAKRNSAARRSTAALQQKHERTSSPRHCAACPALTHKRCACCAAHGVDWKDCNSGRNHAAHCSWHEICCVPACTHLVVHHVAPFCAVHACHRLAGHLRTWRSHQAHVPQQARLPCHREQRRPGHAHARLQVELSSSSEEGHQSDRGEQSVRAVDIADGKVQHGDCKAGNLATRPRGIKSLSGSAMENKQAAGSAIRTRIGKAATGISGLGQLSGQRVLVLMCCMQVAAAASVCRQQLPSRAVHEAEYGVQCPAAHQHPQGRDTHSKDSAAVLHGNVQQQQQAGKFASAPTPLQDRSRVAELVDVDKQQLTVGVHAVQLNTGAAQLAALGACAAGMCGQCNSALGAHGAHKHEAWATWQHEVSASVPQSPDAASRTQPIGAAWDPSATGASTVDTQSSYDGSMEQLVLRTQGDPAHTPAAPEHGATQSACQAPPATGMIGVHAQQQTEAYGVRIAGQDANVQTGAKVMLLQHCQCCTACKACFSAVRALALSQNCSHTSATGNATDARWSRHRLRQSAGCADLRPLHLDVETWTSINAGQKDMASQMSVASQMSLALSEAASVPGGAWGTQQDTSRVGVHFNDTFRANDEDGGSSSVSLDFDSGASSGGSTELQPVRSTAHGVFHRAYQDIIALYAALESHNS